MGHHDITENGIQLPYINLTDKLSVAKIILESFPTYNKSTVDDFENIFISLWPKNELGIMSYISYCHNSQNSSAAGMKSINIMKRYNNN